MCYILYMYIECNPYEYNIFFLALTNYSKSGGETCLKH
jgi:hypothetical protein